MHDLITQAVTLAHAHQATVNLQLSPVCGIPPALQLLKAAVDPPARPTYQGCPDMINMAAQGDVSSEDLRSIQGRMHRLGSQGPVTAGRKPTSYDSII